jgi:hypothetical protein
MAAASSKRRISLTSSVLLFNLFILIYLGVQKHVRITSGLRIINKLSLNNLWRRSWDP